MNESKTAEQIFKPGNLAWGGTFLDNQSLRAFLQEGIKTGTAAGKSEYLADTPDQICMALLSREEDLHIRWRLSTHYGPQGPGFGGNVGVVLSRERLFAAFGDRLFAIGDYFQPRQDLMPIEMVERNGKLQKMKKEGMFLVFR